MYKLLFDDYRLSITGTTERQSQESEQRPVFTPIPIEPITNGNFYQK